MKSLWSDSVNLPKFKTISGNFKTSKSQSTNYIYYFVEYDIDK